MATKRRAPGTGSIRKVNGQYVAEFKLGGGRSRWRRCATASEAEETLAKWIADRNAGRDLAGGAQSLRTWLETWLGQQQHRRRKPLAPKTLEHYEYSLRLAADQLGTRQLDSLTRRDIDALIDNLLEDLAPSTVIHCISTLERALDSALRNGIISKNPAVDMDLPALTTRPAVIFTTDGLQQLRQNVADHPLALVYDLLLLSMRIGEVLGLHLADIDLERGIISIERQRTAVAGKMHETGPKRGSKRTLPIPDALVDDLKTHIASRQASPHESSLLFVTSTGSGYSYRNVSRHWYSVRPVETHLHDLRHTVSSTLAEMECPEDVRQFMLGHKPANVTRHYSQWKQVEALRPWLNRFWSTLVVSDGHVHRLGA